MTAQDNPTALDDCFTLMGEDVDFIGDLVHPDVPVLTYCWSKSRSIARAAPAELLQRGREAMEQVGLIRIRWAGRHLRGDAEGHRVKMTVLRCGGESMFLLMTAGMPGKRRQTQALNRQLAQLLEGPGLQDQARMRNSRTGRSSLIPR